MDDIVAAAMLKWPDVPDVYNWLRLDARGRWRIRARDYESSGRFETIGNPAVNEFIGRNYMADANGRWFFQNGPQRVFVALDCAPWVFHLGATAFTHTGVAATRIDAVFLDELQTPILATDIGPGALSDQDFDAFIATLAVAGGAAPTDAALERWLGGDSDAAMRCTLQHTDLPVTHVTRAALAARYQFVVHPQPPDGAPDCA